MEMNAFQYGGITNKKEEAAAAEYPKKSRLVIWPSILFPSFIFFPLSVVFAVASTLLYHKRNTTLNAAE